MKKIKILLLTFIVSVILGCSVAYAEPQAPSTIESNADLVYFIKYYNGDATIENGVVKLTKSFTAQKSMYFCNSEDIVLDLNGNHIYADSSVSSIGLIWYNSSTNSLKITDSSNSDTDYICAQSTSAVYSSGKNLIIENTVLKSNNSTDDTIAGYQAKNVDIKNCRIVSEKGGISIQPSSIINVYDSKIELGNPTCKYGVKTCGTNAVANLKNVEVKNVQNTTDAYALYSDAETAIINVDGGIFNGYNCGGMIEKGTLNVNGNAIFTSDYGYGIKVVNGNVNVSNGTIKGKNIALFVNVGAKAVLKGGKYIVTSSSSPFGAIGTLPTGELNGIIPNGYFSDITSIVSQNGSKYLDGKTINVYAAPKSVSIPNTSYVYTGSVVTPEVTVKDTNDVKLVKGTDYTVEYASGRVNVGTYNINVKYINKYASFGTKTLSFNITSKVLNSDNAKVDISKTSFVYDGKTKSVNVVLKENNGNVIPASFYTITYKNNKNVGKAVVQITLRGNYSGSFIKTFKINPKGTKISSLKAKSKGFKVSYKKQKSQTTGYEIRYSTKSNMKSSKTVKITKNSTVSKDVKKLKSKKKYYVQIRTYKVVDGVKYYSSWSGTKSVKTLK